MCVSSFHCVVLVALAEYWQPSWTLKAAAVAVDVVEMERLTVSLNYRAQMTNHWPSQMMMVVQHGWHRRMPKT